MVGLLDHSSEFRVITVQFLDAGICWTACRPIFITLSSSFKFAVSPNFLFLPPLNPLLLWLQFVLHILQLKLSRHLPLRISKLSLIKQATQGYQLGIVHNLSCIGVLWKKRRTTCIFVSLYSRANKNITWKEKARKNTKEKGGDWN